MSEPATVFLAIIAVSSLVLALIQVGVLLYAVRLARRMERMRAQIEDGLRPVIAHLETVGTNAAEASRLAVAQAQRADRVFSDLAERAQATMAGVHSAVMAPVRRWRAVMTGVRAGAAAFVEIREEAARARRNRVEEEDPLFIG
ncbi:MAG: hypothetical protein ACE148_11975 [Vicinamibacterales bacterium]